MPIIESIPMTREHLTRGRAGAGVRAIVIHATAGVWPGDYEWLRKGGSTAAPVSCHYLINPDGSRIIQFVADHDTAWHAGASTWNIDGYQRSGLNPWSIGIELSHSNRVEDSHASRQVQTAVELCRMLAKEYDIPREQIVRHIDISPGRKTDPCALNWNAFLNAIFISATPEDSGIEKPDLAVYTGKSLIRDSAKGNSTQMRAYMAKRSRRKDIDEIIDAYQEVAEFAGIDWFLALAQACHETGNFTSALSQPSNRDGVYLNNFAGIGVTGAWSQTPRPGYVYDADHMLYRACVAFPNVRFAARAHIGRLLLYASAMLDRNEEQEWLIEEARSWRDLPIHLQGVAKHISDLSSRWGAKAGYGERVAALAERIRKGE